MITAAKGPKIDVADGNWHTITCIKYADGAGSTGVQVIVDGVAGNLYVSSQVIGDIVFTNDAVDLGGQGPKANKDSIDGQYTSVSYSLG